ncbi:MAG: histidine kinase [Burkholderiales bacterium]|nr:histidine kinase [Burkholderiales bacterium]
MKSISNATPAIDPAARLRTIESARQVAMHERASLPAGSIAPWVVRSWERCMQQGLQPQQNAVFDLVSQPQARRTQDENEQLVRAARPILEKLGNAIVNTRYFAILTNSDGVVVDASGPIDRSDPRAHLLTRIGTDLSEGSVGTTAISTALFEKQPVWLHRGEHFFANTTMYSCAGAPLWGPDGACVGMLDLTGIDAIERPELKHLVTQTAGKIENALLRTRPYRVLLRLNWPGNTLGTDADGILCLDADGWITGANTVARQMVPHLSASGQSGQPCAVHASEVFGVAFGMLLDCASRDDPILEIPLWTGLVLQALVLLPGDESRPLRAGAREHNPALPLKDIETALIRKAVDQARGNVAQAALALGISRATVYRKLGSKSGGPTDTP